jgi:two-component system OmpR family sensor kinase
VFAKSTLRGRLTLSYTLGLLLALLSFATLALVAIDTVQRHAIETELRAVARDEAATVGYDAYADTITASGAARFGAVAGSRVASALLADDGRPLVASAARVPDAIVQSALAADQTVTATVPDHGNDLRAVFVPLESDGVRRATIATWSDIGPIERVDRKIGMSFAIAIPFITGFATFLGSRIARRGLVPLDRMIAEASEIEANALSARITQPDTSELHRLAATLNRMLERLDAAFERERRFTDDASHEFRAPLSVILAEADLTLSAERTNGQYKRSLETIAIEAEAMERLTRNLLATARRSDGDAAPAATLLDLGDVAQAAVSRMQILADRRGVIVRSDCTGEATIAADPDEIEQAVVIVVHNAIKFAAPRGTVRVSVFTSERFVEIRVSDDGPGFSESALAHAFDRFWRESGSDRQSGHGLGLPIARAIVERHRGTVTLANAADGGAVVALTFGRRDAHAETA